MPTSDNTPKIINTFLNVSIFGLTLKITYKKSYEFPNIYF